jgi:chitinase
VRLHRLAAASATLLLLLSGCSKDDGTTGGIPAASAEPTGRALGVTSIPPALKVAPYLDLTAGDVDVAELAKMTGQTDFTLAFVLARGARDCTATWGGRTPIDDDAALGRIAGIDELGGNVIVATGGASGTYLENACSEGQLVTAYEKALDAAGANRLDVDIEQEVNTDQLARSLAALQQARGTAITLTVPVGGTSDGLNDSAIALLKSAKENSVEVTVNAMTMNFNAAGGGWGRAMTLAAEQVRDDVAAVWPDASGAEIYRMLGVTPMIGVNNTGGTMRTADATYLLDWARDKKVGFVRFWSVNRDNGGCGNGTVAAGCSGISQSKYQFTNQFHDFAD